MKTPLSVVVSALLLNILGLVGITTVAPSQAHAGADRNWHCVESTSHRSPIALDFVFWNESYRAFVQSPIITRWGQVIPQQTRWMSERVDSREGEIPTIWIITDLTDVLCKTHHAQSCSFAEMRLTLTREASYLAILTYDSNSALLQSDLRRMECR